MYDDSLVVFLESDGEHMFGSGNPWALLKSFPELFGFLPDRRTFFATEGGPLPAYGNSSGSVSLINNDRTIPIHLCKVLVQWYTRSAVSVERILHKHTIIVRCDDGLKELHVKLKNNGCSD